MSNESIELYLDLFSKNPKRHLVLRNSVAFLNKSLAKRNINIWRNTGVEHITRLIQIYLNYFDIDPEFKLSNFDITFSLENHEQEDLDLFIIDTDQYEVLNLNKLISSKIEEILNIGSRRFAFYLLSSLNDEEILKMITKLKSENIGVDIFSMNEIQEIDEVKKQSTRLNKLTASWLSPEASNLVARDIAIRSILPKFKPILKLVVFDLDNTLYRGILSEDGTENLYQTEADTKLVKLIENMRKQNLMTGLITKNNKNEILELFQKRKDFGLTLKTFDFLHSDWEPKSTHMQSILQEANLGPTSVLFVDDNFMELELMSQGNPGINLVPGGLDEVTTRIVEYYLNFSLKNNANGKIDRVDDIRARQDRISILEKLDFNQAQRNLETRITVSKIREEDLTRISELSLKTNQFNFNFCRFQLPNLIDIYKNSRREIIKINLQDKFVDSGLVGFLMIGVESAAEIVIDELCISCRAIGRGLESEMIYSCLKIVIKEKDIKMNRVRIKYKEGPRNQQVVDWAKREKLRFDGKDFLIETSKVIEYSKKEFVVIKSD